VEVSGRRRREESTVNIVATTAVSFSPTLAHQGGWDEILLVAGPIVVIVGLLALVKRRIDALAEHSRTEPADSAGGSSGDFDGRALDSRPDSA